MCGDCEKLSFLSGKTQSDLKNWLFWLGERTIEIEKLQRYIFSIADEENIGSSLEETTRLDDVKEKIRITIERIKKLFDFFGEIKSISVAPQEYDQQDFKNPVVITSKNCQFSGNVDEFWLPLSGFLKIGDVAYELFKYEEGVFYLKNDTQEYWGKIQEGGLTDDNGVLSFKGKEPFMYWGGIQKGVPHGPGKKENGSGSALVVEDGKFVNGDFIFGRKRLPIGNGRFYEGGCYEQYPDGDGMIMDETGKVLETGTWIQGHKQDSLKEILPLRVVTPIENLFGPPEEPIELNRASISRMAKESGGGTLYKSRGSAEAEPAILLDKKKVNREKTSQKRPDQTVIPTAEIPIIASATSGQKATNSAINHPESQKAVPPSTDTTQVFALEGMKTKKSSFWGRVKSVARKTVAAAALIFTLGAGLKTEVETGQVESNQSLVTAPNNEKENVGKKQATTNAGVRIASSVVGSNRETIVAATRFQARNNLAFKTSESVARNSDSEYNTKINLDFSEPEITAEFSSARRVKKGDNLWNILRDELNEKQVGFSQLPDYCKSYLIHALVKEYGRQHPKKNPNLLRVGEAIDVQKLVDDYGVDRLAELVKKVNPDSEESDKKLIKSLRQTREENKRPEESKISKRDIGAGVWQKLLSWF